MSIDKKWYAAIVLVVLALGWRVFNYQHMIAPGFELVTAASLVAAAMLPRRAALVVPLSVMVAGDLIMGNSPILTFTWSAFALIGLSGLYLRRWQGGRLVLAGTAGGILSALFFFVYTNFGVWLTGTMYEHTWAGLVDCYIMALPFYRMNLIGNLVAVPALFTLAVYGPGLVRGLVGRLRIRRTVKA
jgi:hypothetical protein